MRTVLQVDFDTDRKDSKCLVIKPTIKEFLDIPIAFDLYALCEAIIGIMRAGENAGILSSAKTLKACIEHLEKGFMQAEMKAVMFDVDGKPLIQTKDADQHSTTPKKKD
jgi:hypothetical protein